MGNQKNKIYLIVKKLNLLNYIQLKKINKKVYNNKNNFPPKLLKNPYKTP
jgi:hypothetical protein